MNTIDITDFQGLFTNGDPTDIPKEYATELKNLRAVNGRLDKTFGFGETLGVGYSGALNNLFVFTHEEFSSGYLYVVLRVAGANNLVSIYAYDPVATPSGFVPLQSVIGIEFINSVDFYHVDATNPIFQVDGVLRILPGAATAFGGNDAKGVWLGYIDRTLFDEIVTVDSGFYIDKTEILRPELSVYPDQYDCDTEEGAFNEVVKHYRFSYLYDGIQESLMSEPVTVSFGAYKFLRNTFSITKADHNSRITGIKVYRSDSADRGYKNIQTIDFLRKESEMISEDRVVGVNGAASNGRLEVYIDFDKLSMDEPDWSIEYNYQIIVDPDGDSQTAAMKNPAPSMNNNYGGGYNLTDTLNNLYTYWNSAWKIEKQPVAGGTWETVTEANTGLYAGAAVVVTNAELTHGVYAGGVFIWTDAYQHMVANNVKHALLTVGNAFLMNGSYKLLKPFNGLYYFTDNTTTVDVTFYDTGLTEGAASPLEGEKSIEVNGAVGAIVGARLWQGDIILDPHGKAEKHPDWISFSEMYQYDVNPVSNVLPIYDREGGAVMGVAELYGNPVVLKKKSIISVDIKADLADPSKWGVSESKHNIGCVSKTGWCVAQDALYICAKDGIYRLTPNNLAASDLTPTEKLKVSDAIGDYYDSLSPAEKASVKLIYNQELNELVFVWDIYHRSSFSTAFDSGFAKP